LFSHIIVVQEELAIVQEESSFGSVLDLDILGISLSDDALTPGVAIASSRAIGLAGRLSLQILKYCIVLMIIW
jgi:hypothetical protein